MARKVSGAKARRLLAGIEQPKDGKVPIWHMGVGLSQDEFDHKLIATVGRACEVHHDLAVTSKQVSAQLPDPSPDLEWDLQSIGQMLRRLADRGLMLRCGMYSNGSGSPTVQHWWAPSLTGRARDTD